TVSPLLLTTLAPSSRSLARYWLAVWPLKKVFLGISTFLAASGLGSSFFCARAGRASAAAKARARANLCMGGSSFERGAIGQTPRSSTERYGNSRYKRKACQEMGPRVVLG